MLKPVFIFFLLGLTEMALANEESLDLAFLEWLGSTEKVDAEVLEKLLQEQEQQGSELKSEENSQ